MPNKSKTEPKSEPKSEEKSFQERVLGVAADFVSALYFVGQQVHSIAGVMERDERRQAGETVPVPDELRPPTQS